MDDSEGVGPAADVASTDADSELEAATLVARALAGDDAAEREILSRYYNHVHRLVQRSLGPGSDPDDLTQDIFLNVFRSLKTIRKAGSLRSFVFAVAHNIIRVEIRRQRIGRMIGLTSTGQLPDIRQDEPVDPDAAQALRRIYDILKNLRIRERETFVLRQLVGLRLIEVAATLKRSLATVKRDLTKASSRFSEEIRKDPFLSAYLAQSNIQIQAPHEARDERRDDDEG
jgi:RNA polymerase sigma-70 factor, ECF subfamily